MKTFTLSLSLFVSCVIAFASEPDISFRDALDALRKEESRDRNIRTQSILHDCIHQAKEWTERCIEIIAENMGNLSTPAYKALLPIPNANPFYFNDEGDMRLVSYFSKCNTAPPYINRNFNQGSLFHSNQNSHLAIQGLGFFKVMGPKTKKVFATRLGTFFINSDGQFALPIGNCILQGLLADPSTEPKYTVSYKNNTLVYDTDLVNERELSFSGSTVGSLHINFNPTVENGGLVRDESIPKEISNEDLAQGAPKMRAYTINLEGKIQIQLSDGNEFIRGQVILLSFINQQALTLPYPYLYSNLEEAGQVNEDLHSISSALVRQRMIETSNVDPDEELAKIHGLLKQYKYLKTLSIAAEEMIKENF